MDKQTFRSWLRQRTKKYWIQLLLCGLFVAVTGLLSLLQPLVFKFLADYVYATTKSEQLDAVGSRNLAQIGLFYAAVTLLMGTVASLSSRFKQRLENMVNEHSVQESFAVLTAVAYNNPRRLSDDDSLQTITNKARWLGPFIVNQFVTRARLGVTIAGSIAVLAIIDPRLAMAMVVIHSLLLLLVLAAKHERQLVASFTNTAESINEFVEDSLLNLRLVQAYAKQPGQLRQLSGLMAKDHREKLIASGNSRIYAALTSAVLGVSGLIVLLYFGSSSAKLSISLGNILLFLAYLKISNNSFRLLFEQQAEYAEQANALSELKVSLDLSSRLLAATGNQQLLTVSGKMELRHVRLQGTYKLLFTDLNLVMLPRTITAVIGASGSGKSSLLSLLNGFMSPTAGQVLLDDVSLSQLDINFVRRNIAIVDQESLMMNDTIARNIAFSDQERSNSLPDVMAAAVISNATEFIDSLASNYQTVIENEVVSGGQKQRLAIARAYYAKTPIVIMDEPTAALDRQSAQIFADNLLKYFANRTVLIATHDLALLRKIDKVFILQDQVLIPVDNINDLDLEKYRLID